MVRLSLQDYQPNDTSHNEEITDELTKNVLRYLSSHNLKGLLNEEGHSIFVIPHSYENPKDKYTFEESRILEYVERNNNPEYIKTTNLLGFVGYQDVHIEIHSRFSVDLERDYFLFYMLSKVMSINLVDLKTLSGNKSFLELNLLMFFFPKLLKEAMTQGLFKEYSRKEYNDANVKGVIDINKHIRMNIPANGRIAYRTREHCFDNHITQLIRHTIEYIRKSPFGQIVLHNDSETASCVQLIKMVTPSYQIHQRTKVIHDNLRPLIHPYFCKYTALQALCLRILRQEKMSYGENNDAKIHGILIDASWLWEEFVAHLLSHDKHWKGMKHCTWANSSYHLLRNNNIEIQKIIPDYYDKNESIVADAKYIPLNRYSNYNLPPDKVEGIYYKTIMYMCRFKSSKGYLCYPYKNYGNDNPKDTDLAIIDKSEKIKIRGIEIPHVENGKDDEEEYRLFCSKFDKLSFEK